MIYQKFLGNRVTTQTNKINKYDILADTIQISYESVMALTDKMNNYFYIGKLANSMSQESRQNFLQVILDDKHVLAFEDDYSEPNFLAKLWAAIKQFFKQIWFMIVKVLKRIGSFFKYVYSLFRTLLKFDSFKKEKINDTVDIASSIIEKTNRAEVEKIRKLFEQNKDQELIKEIENKYQNKINGLDIDNGNESIAKAFINDLANEINQKIGFKLIDDQFFETVVLVSSKSKQSNAGSVKDKVLTSIKGIKLAFTIIRVIFSSDILFEKETFIPFMSDPWDYIRNIIEVRYKTVFDNIDALTSDDSTVRIKVWNSQSDNIKIPTITTTSYLVLGLDKDDELDLISYKNGVDPRISSGSYDSQMIKSDFFDQYSLMFKSVYTEPNKIDNAIKSINTFSEEIDKHIEKMEEITKVKEKEGLTVSEVERFRKLAIAVTKLLNEDSKTIFEILKTNKVYLDFFKDNFNE